MSNTQNNKTTQDTQLFTNINDNQASTVQGGSGLSISLLEGLLEGTGVSVKADSSL